ncbi:MAG: hypothetical protein HFI86_06880 [Bacilli bacterium]|nr:hypothetical protein [Bacilli bacterium]
MDRLDQIIFINNLPTIDLHGFDSETARVAINDFINDNYKMQNNFIIIIHGIGKGIIKKITFETLKKNRKILEFKSYYYNNGCTIAKIDLK